MSLRRSRSEAILKVVTALALLLGAAVAVSLAPAAADATPPAEGTQRLVLSSIPPEIPADNQTYPSLVVSLVNASGLPVVALHSVQVYLTSDSQDVASVSSTVVIEPGRSYSVANVTTSGTPGSTTVTASAAGLASASALIKTVIPSGFPDHLVAFAVPAVQLARAASQGEVVVQVQDDLGIPARTAGPVSVSIASSDERILTVSSSALSIPAGESFAWESYATNTDTGSATITVSASGFTTGATTVEVVQAPPLVLKVAAEPDLIAPQSTGRIVVSLSDSNGNPAEAPVNLQIFLTSSNLTVAVVSNGASGLSPFELVIPKNQTYATTTFTSVKNGTTVFTASAHGLVSGFANVTVGQAQSANELRLFLSPDPVPTGQVLPAIGVGLAYLNQNSGKLSPSVASYPVQVVVTASDNATGRVIELTYLTLKAGESYAVANFTSTQLPSVAIITAAAQDLRTSQATMYTLRPDLPIGPPPTAVVVTPVAPSFPADGNQYQGLLLSLRDSSGGPAIAPVDIQVHLSLNRTDVIQLVNGPTATISANESYTIVEVKTLSVQGTVNVTAESPGYSSSWTLVSARALSPARLAIYVAPSPAIISASGHEALLAIQLQDSQGDPARARAQTTVTLVSSNTTLLSRPLAVTIALRSDYSLLSLNSSVPSVSTITATTPGLQPANVTFTSVQDPVTTQLHSFPSTIYMNETATFTASVSVQGIPLPNATVAWHVDGGSLVNETTTTDADGIATAVFHGSAPGLASIYATLSSPVFGTLNTTSANVVIQSYPVLSHKQTGLLPTILSHLLYVVSAAAAVVVIAVVVVLRRRRGGVEEGDSFGIGPAPGEGTALDLRGSA